MLENVPGYRSLTFKIGILVQKYWFKYFVLTELQFKVNTFFWLKKKFSDQICIKNNKVQIKKIKKKCFYGFKYENKWDDPCRKKVNINIFYKILSYNLSTGLKKEENKDYIFDISRFSTYIILFLFCFMRPGG